MQTRSNQVRPARESRRSSPLRSARRLRAAALIWRAPSSLAARATLACHSAGIESRRFQAATVDSGAPIMMASLLISPTDKLESNSRYEATCLPPPLGGWSGCRAFVIRLLCKKHSRAVNSRSCRMNS
jgi:hypothetical protein